MNRIKNLICNLKAIPPFIKVGIWCPHMYEETERYQTNVFATEDSFRESSSLCHTEAEKAYIGATVVVMRCVDCGRELRGWQTKEPRTIYTEKGGI